MAGLEPASGWGINPATLTALAGAAGLAVAVYALAVWRRSIRHDRIDALVLALYDLRGCVVRALEGRKHAAAWAWNAYGRAWLGWREVDKAYAVLQRHERGLPDRVPERLAEALHQAEAVLADESLDPADVEQRRREIDLAVLDVIAGVKQHLPSAHPWWRR